MTEERKAAILACLAPMSMFAWLIFPELGFIGLCKLGAVSVVAAGVALAIPCKDESDEG